MILLSSPIIPEFLGLLGVWDEFDNGGAGLAAFQLIKVLAASNAAILEVPHGCPVLQGVVMRSSHPLASGFA